ncbi:MAG: hypothetical protein JW781_10100 [Deltaproteobacteria bacterium]|nr:hypothetical protein [Candidatus Anaeroferrophillacea bacterium]
MKLRAAGVLLLVFGMLLAVRPATAVGMPSAPDDNAAVRVPGDRLTNEDCFKCHKEVALAGGALDGSAKSLFIDRDRFMDTLHGKKLVCLDCHEGADNKSHLRAGYPRPNCMACHSDIDGLYPYNARKRLTARGIKIPKEKLVGNTFLNGEHGKALLAGKPDAADCQDCHTNHYPLGKRDAASTVHPDNLQATCGRCHQERLPAGMIGKLASFRVQAHRKADLRYSFTRDACVDCHQGAAAHGEEKLSNAPCQRCHDKKIQPAGIAFGHFHLFPDHDNQFGTWMIRNFYGFLVAGLLTLVLLWGGYAGLRRIAAYYRQENEGE